MQEIKIAGNKTGLRVLIDEPPDVGQLHDEDFNVGRLSRNKLIQTKKKPY